MQISSPFDGATIAALRAGTMVRLTGAIYTARDAAHKLMFEALAAGDAAPFEYDGQAVFYAGPCPAPPGRPIGSVGPTTAGRMDAYAPALIRAGLKVMIAKGNRSPAVVDAIKAHGGLYLAAVGGVAALMAQCVQVAQLVAYPHLGTEAVYRLDVRDMPLVVAIDAKGGSIYER